MKFLNKLLFLSGVMACSCGFENSKLDQIDQYIKDQHHQGTFSGSLVVGNSEGIIYSKSLGFADQAMNVEINEATTFDVASLNKSFQAYLILKLVESNHIQLDDPIKKHLALTNIAFDSINIHQLLTHTSGVGSYEHLPERLQQDNFRKFKRSHFTPVEYLSFLDTVEMIGIPGGQFYYSNFGYHLLSLMIEELCEKPFHLVLDSLITGPLELTQTYSPVDNETIYPNMAQSYVLQGDIFRLSPFIDFSIGRRIFCTAKDLYRWGVEMQSFRQLSPKLGAKMKINHLSKIDSSFSYGYGWVILDQPDRYRMGDLGIKGSYQIHGGSTDGFQSILVIHEKGWIISMLANTDQTNGMTLAKKLLTILIEA